MLNLRGAVFGAHQTLALGKIQRYLTSALLTKCNLLIKQLNYDSIF